MPVTFFVTLPLTHVIVVCLEFALLFGVGVTVITAIGGVDGCKGGGDVCEGIGDGEADIGLICT